MQIRIADLSLESGLTDLTVAALPVLPCKKGDSTGKPEALDRRASEFGFVDPQSGGAEYTCQFAVEQPAIAQVDAYSVGDAKLLLSDDQNNVLAEMDQVLAGTADQPARKSMQAVLVPGSNYLVGLSSFSGGFGGEVAIHATLRWIQQKDIERVVVAAELTSGGTVIIEAGQMRAFRFDGDRLFESAAFDGVLLKRGRGGELSSQASAMPFLLPEDAVLIADASLDSTLALTEATAGDPLIEGAALEKQPPLSNVRLHLFESRSPAARQRSGSLGSRPTSTSAS